MELFCGILFALAYFVFGISFELLIALGIIGLLIILSVSDISYFVIPDEILIFFSGYFIIINCLNKGVMYSLYTILSGICLFLVMYGILLLGNFVFKKESLGGGDVKLMFVIGLVINPILGLIVIFIGSLVALPVSLILLYKKRQNLIPFGPFLLISFTLVYFTGININMILEFLKTI
jgi:leader peptidase (prepilin peptidase)/N-methyltransferase